jgi:hypothetical protein
VALLCLLLLWLDGWLVGWLGWFGWLAVACSLAGWVGWLAEKCQRKTASTCDIQNMCATLLKNYEKQ